MILVVDMCYEKNSLSAQEFVRPVVQIVGKISDYKTVHYSQLNEKIVSDCKKIILCGVALKDNEYLEHMERFEFIKKTEKPLLGICSGMQVIGLVFGSSLDKKTEIGMTWIKLKKSFLSMESDFEAYCLHNNSITLPPGFDILAESESGIQAFRHKNKPLYGVMFHPEVRNPEIIRKFIS
jgi:GMP synthase-like glutamine amidotransferase